MSNFILTTDSGCDLPLELLNQQGVFTLKMSYSLNGEIFTDTMNPDDYKEFYAKMRNGAVPKTSQLNVSDFMNFFTPLVGKCKNIVYVSLSSGVSGTYNNAVTAAKELKETLGANIHVVDSLMCSTGYGALVLKAARMRDDGCDAEQCANWLNENKLNLNTYYTTDDLTYLTRSGRCSKTSAILGTIFKICPILNVIENGKLNVCERARGFKKAMQKIGQLIAKTVENAAKQTLYICHSDVIERAKEFGQFLLTSIGFKDVLYTDIGTIIGSNCGPGVVAAFYFGKSRATKA